MIVVCECQYPNGRLLIFWLTVTGRGVKREDPYTQLCGICASPQG